MVSDTENKKSGSESEGDEGSEYEVEAIIEKKTVKKKNLYLIRWKGYGPEYDTWEPELSLQETATDILAEFKRRERAKSNSATATPLKKRPPRPPADASSDSEAEPTPKKGRKDSESSDDEYVETKKNSVKKGKAKEVTSAPRPVAQPAPKPLTVQSLAWLNDVDDDDSDDEEERKKKEEEERKRKEEFDRKQKDREEEEERKRNEECDRKQKEREEEDRKNKDIEEEEASEEKQRQDEEKEAERRAEKERKKAEKEKRKEEKRRQKESDAVDAPSTTTESLPVPKLTIKMGSPSATATNTDADSSVLGAAPAGADPLATVMSLWKTTAGVVMATALRNGTEEELTLREAWNYNPFGLVQYLLSRHQFNS